MENLIFSFNVVMPVFLVVAVGYLIKKIGLVDDKFINTAIKFNFNVGLSTLIFKNIYTTNLNEVFNLKLILFTFFCIVGTALFLCLIIPVFIKNKQKASAMIHTIYRSNFILLGFPLAINMFGESNVAPVALLLPITIPTYNFLAVVILSIFDEDKALDKKTRIKSTVTAISKNPLIIGSFIGVFFSLFSLKLPAFMEKAVFDVASLGTPLTLITLGAQFNFKNALGNLKYSLLASFGRLVIVPLAVVTLAFLVGFRSYELGSIFILFSSPTAVSCYVMAKEMNSDYELTGEVIIISTLFSAVTIFAGIYLLRVFSLV
jgi:malate permease and related proteins